MALQSQGIGDGSWPGPLRAPRLPRRAGQRFSFPGGLSFQEVPDQAKARAFGVDYVWMVEPDGGQLYVTRYGWTCLSRLRPARWFRDQRYAKDGRKLAGGTGAVYRAPTGTQLGDGLDLVVKFSRVAQDVPLVVATSFASHLPQEQTGTARFSSPFEEFGAVMALRRGPNLKPELRIRTKRPLAVYVPPRAYDAWQLGRSSRQFRIHQRALQKQQTGPIRRHSIELEMDHDYIELFEWVQGLNAEEAVEAGWISEQQMLDLTNRSYREMLEKGFTVLDHKAKHLILRCRDSGQVLSRHGQIIYVLVDFELLQRLTPEAAAQMLRDFKTQHA